MAPRFHHPPRSDDEGTQTRPARDHADRPRLTAIIHLTVPRSEIQSVMGPGLSEVMAAVAAQGLGPAGPWFTHHPRMAPDVFDFESSVPVTAPFTAVGRVKPSQWPAMKVARTVSHGAFEGLGAAWGEFNAWLGARRPHAGPRPLGALPRGPGVEPRPGPVAHGAHPASG